MADSVQREARALGDPTRHRIFSYIVEAEHPVGVAELTAHVQLNHNAVRQHLAVLRDAGLVVEEVEERDRPGRPRLLYRLNPEVGGTWGTPGPYEELASLLSSALTQHRGTRETGQAAGRERAARLDHSAGPVATLEAEMVVRGFRPARVERGRRVEFVLGRCPYEKAAAGSPDTVCQLHLGLAEGLAEGVGGVEVTRLIAMDPRRAGCRLVLRRTGAGTGRAFTSISS
ncbi:MAG: helix-turn-helix transcriptional regulator [Acidimicrobiales bacterium]